MSIKGVGKGASHQSRRPQEREPWSMRTTRWRRASMGGDKVDGGPLAGSTVEDRAGNLFLELGEIRQPSLDSPEAVHLAVMHAAGA
jgi:hypothetical protein